MNVDYIIVQAGGKGSRMGYLTYNKPKALVPIENLPILFHLFRKYPEKKYVIVGDYKYEVLEKYLKVFSEVKYQLVNARGKKGTCAGLKEAIAYIPDGYAFMLIWSDLILSDEYKMPQQEKNYIGLSKDFQCRWKYEDKEFAEEPSSDRGVAGLFIFQARKYISDVPEEGEFVRWVKGKEIQFEEIPLYKTKEYGLLEEYRNLEKKRCRPFNRIITKDEFIIKEAIDSQGKELAVREIAWYEKMRNWHFLNIPKIYNTNPLKMERIEGKNIYEYQLSFEEKRKILDRLVNCIKSIHSLEECITDKDSFYEAYIGKTMRRLEKVYDLIPFAHDKTVRINGVNCSNVFFQKEKIKKMIYKYMPEKFCLIHGDCTFSNILLKNGTFPIMIDPRGYFGFTDYYGDPAYDWAKIYYSIVGNYDQFNLKRFTLKIEKEEVFLDIDSNQWEDMEEIFFELIEGEATREQIKIIHTIIWLSLTTYAWEDYDSICGAFYKGLITLQEIL